MISIQAVEVLRTLTQRQVRDLRLRKLILRM